MPWFDPRRLLASLAIALVGCAASVPKPQHDAELAEQKAEYEGRLVRAEDARAAAERAREDGRREARAEREALTARVEALEASLAERRRWLDVPLLADPEARSSTSERSLRPEDRRAAAGGDRAARGQLTALVELLAQAWASERGVRVEARGPSVLVRVPDGVFFSRGSQRLLPEAKPALQRLYAVLSRCDGCLLRVDAHTDSIIPEGADTDAWSVTDGQGRALVRAVQHFGVDPSRLAYASFGQGRPLASNETEDGRAENRRIELIFTPVPSR